MPMAGPSVAVSTPEPTPARRWLSALSALPINVAPQSLVKSHWNQFRSGTPLWRSIAAGQSTGRNLEPRHQVCWLAARLICSSR
jgi:hypothetical protein